MSKTHFFHHRLSHAMKKWVFGHVRTVKTIISLCICSFARVSQTHFLIEWCLFAGFNVAWRKQFKNGYQVGNAVKNVLPPLSLAQRLTSAFQFNLR